MRCNRCGQDNRQGAHFCARCGNRMDQTACGRCGGPISPGQKFCARCGAPAAALPPPRRRGGKAAVWAAVAVLCAVALIGGSVLGGCSLLRRRQSPAPTGEPAAEAMADLSLHFNDLHGMTTLPVVDGEGEPSQAVARGPADGASWPVCLSQGLTAETAALAVDARDALDTTVPVRISGPGPDATLSLPAENLGPGMAYILTLPEGVSFTEEDLAGVRVLTYIVNRADTEYVLYKSDVRQLSAGEAEPAAGGLWMADAGDIAPGDVLVVPVNEGGGEPRPRAYKVESMTQRDGGVLLTTADPSLEEVFDNLEISGTWSMDPDAIVIDEEAIADAVRNSAFYDRMLSAASVAPVNPDNVKITVKKLPSQDGFLRVRIKMTIQDALGKGANYTYTLDIGYKADFDVNIVRTLVFDFCCNSQTTVDLSFSLDGEKKTRRAFSDIVKGVDGPPEPGVINGQEYMDLLEEEIREEGKSVLTIGSYPMPISGPVWLTIDLDAYVSRTLTGNLDLGSGVEVLNKSGAVVSPTCFKPYSSSQLAVRDTYVTGIVKAEYKAGLQVGVMLTVCKIVDVGVEAQGGGYVELAGAFDVGAAAQGQSLEDGLFGYLEVGPYYQVDFSASANLLIKEFNYRKTLAQQKWPLISLGRRTWIQALRADGESVTLGSDGSGTLPALKAVYLDVFTGKQVTQAILPTDLVLSADGAGGLDYDEWGTVRLTDGIGTAVSLTLSSPAYPNVRLTLPIVWVEGPGPVGGPSLTYEGDVCVTGAVLDEANGCYRLTVMKILHDTPTISTGAYARLVAEGYIDITTPCRGSATRLYAYVQDDGTVWLSEDPALAVMPWDEFDDEWDTPIDDYWSPHYRLWAVEGGYRISSFNHQWNDSVTIDPVAWEVRVPLTLTGENADYYDNWEVPQPFLVSDWQAYEDLTEYLCGHLNYLTITCRDGEVTKLTTWWLLDDGPYVLGQ